MRKQCNCIVFFLVLLTVAILVACKDEGFGNADGRISVVSAGVTDIDETSAIGHSLVKIEGESIPPDYRILNGLIVGTDPSVLEVKYHSYLGPDNYNLYYDCFQAYSYQPISNSAFIINIRILDTTLYEDGSIASYGYWESAGTGEFSYRLTNLLRGTKYYVRAFAHVTNGWTEDIGTFNKYIYGEINDFISGGITEDPTAFISVDALGIGVMKEDLGEGLLYDAMRLPQLGYPYINHLEIGGYNDWRLPTLAELKEIYKLRNQIGGFRNGEYWSGDFYDDVFYYYVDFANNGEVGSKVSLKGSYARLVRPLP